MIARTVTLIARVEHTPWRSMGSGLRGTHARFDSGDVVIGLLILAGVVLAMVFLSRYLASHDRGRVYNSPRALFRSLCKAHNLDRGSRRLLWQVARWQRLAHPARLFLEANRFDAANLSPQLRQQADLLKQLQTRLFEGPQSCV
jgi:hypothetical protein